jgi:hypothetical protein
MSVELTITIKDEEGKKLSKSYLIYDKITLTEDDPVIDKYLKELLDEFDGTPDDVRIKAIMVMQ